MLRDMVRETQLHPDDLILPLFVSEKASAPREVASMPGVYQHTLDSLVAEAQKAANAGIPAVLLFGVPAEKDEIGSQAYHDEGVIQQAVRRLKKEVPGLVVVTDVCLCEYTRHGHCGVVHGGEGDFQVENDPSVELLVKTALSHARAGADIVAPSDMMDGRIGAIRSHLDEEGFEEVVIMSYAAKFASAFYGPFRDAGEGAPQFGDRRTYQMDPANAREALRETGLDIEQGADLVMVKPGLAYLDILHRVKSKFQMPTAVYHVSGEYSMIKAAAANGWLEEKAVVLEVMTAFKRAGADLIITYSALDAARWIREGVE